MWVLVSFDKSCPDRENRSCLQGQCCNNFSSLKLRKSTTIFRSFREAFVKERRYYLSKVLNRRSKKNGWWDNLKPRTIWHKRTIWHRPCKEDNLTPRTIWHLGQFDTIIDFIFLQLFGPKIWLEIYWLPLSIFLTENYSQCQIVLFCMMVSNCPILHDGVKLS